MAITRAVDEAHDLVRGLVDGHGAQGQLICWPLLPFFGPARLGFSRAVWDAAAAAHRAEELMKELEVLSIPLRRQWLDAYGSCKRARVWCGAHRGLWLPAMDRAALSGNYGVVRCCPALF